MRSTPNPPSHPVSLTSLGCRTAVPTAALSFALRIDPVACCQTPTFHVRGHLLDPAVAPSSRCDQLRDRAVDRLFFTPAKSQSRSKKWSVFSEKNYIQLPTFPHKREEKPSNKYHETRKYTRQHMRHAPLRAPVEPLSACPGVAGIANESSHSARSLLGPLSDISRCPPFFFFRVVCLLSIRSGLVSSRAHSYTQDPFAFLLIFPRGSTRCGHYVEPSRGSIAEGRRRYHGGAAAAAADAATGVCVCVSPCELGVFLALSSC